MFLSAGKAKTLGIGSPPLWGISWQKEFYLALEGSLHRKSSGPLVWVWLAPPRVEAFGWWVVQETSLRLTVCRGEV